jgi:nucleotide-binding universal stress UspA family protein
MIVLKRILVATDFSEASDAALEYGRQLARQFGASIDVLHVATELATALLAPQGFTVDLERLQRDTEDAARQRLDELVSDEDRRDLHARTVLRTGSKVAAVILAYAEQEPCDLLLVGTHSRSGLQHLLLGSVAERVVRLAPCSVLTVRHHQRDFVRPDALERVADRAT